MDAAHRLRGRAPARRRQAGRARRPPGRRARDAARSCTACSRTSVAGGEDPERPGIVHRLDRDTSGLLVVARSEEAHRRAAGAHPPPRLEREYVALVRGRPRSRSGRIEAPIGRDRGDPTRHVARHGHAASRRSRTSRSTSCSPRTRSCASGSRRAARTRSASTSPRSGCRSPATRSTGSRATSGSSASSSTPPGSRSSIRSRLSAVEVESPLPEDLDDGARAGSAPARLTS